MVMWLGTSNSECFVLAMLKFLNDIGWIVGLIDVRFSKIDNNTFSDFNSKDNSNINVQIIQLLMSDNPQLAAILSRKSIQNKGKFNILICKSGSKLANGRLWYEKSLALWQTTCLLVEENFVFKMCTNGRKC